VHDQSGMSTPPGNLTGVPQQFQQNPRPWYTAQDLRNRALALRRTP